jgi:hypothetical protein|tara:strand:- start:741 stop:971 length:231 start_codon:yes stop_codon:yes gene_type:complete
MSSLRSEIISSLIKSADGEIQKARMNVEVYLHHPVGIGEHPDVVAAIQEQLDIIAHNEERIQVIEKHFAHKGEVYK